MNKKNILISTLLVAPLALAACAGGLESKYSESLKLGAEQEGIELSDGTADCIAENQLPLMKEDLLEEKIDSGNDYRIDDPELYTDGQEGLEKAQVFEVTCLSNSEFSDALGITEDQGTCVIDGLGGKDEMADTILNDEAKFAEALTGCV